MGAMRAVKVIWRRQFESDRPYEREFAGIQRFEPVSRSSGGLVHRDVKPGNIIYAHGRAKLADIGLVSTGGEGRTFVGTEGYIPPEGPGAPAADLYALGVALYEASTGFAPEKFPDVPAEWFAD